MVKLKVAIFCFIGLAAAIGSTFVLRVSKVAILRDQAWHTGAEFAGFIERDMPQIEQILSGNPDTEETEAELHRLAMIGDVFRFEFHDAHGKQVFTTGSFHGATDSTPASHHAHSHETQAETQLQGTQLLPLNTFVVALQPDDQHDHGPAEGHSSSATVVDDIQIYTGDGQLRPTSYAVIFHPISGVDGAIIGSVTFFLDLTEQDALLQKVLIVAVSSIVLLILFSMSGPSISYVRALRAKRNADEKIHFLAAHDVLTGQMNRTTFTKSVEHCLAEETNIAVHFLDVDNFKTFNDSFGHELGDTVLKTCADRICALSDGNLFVARLGGDEFAVLQKNVSNATAVESVSQKIVDAMREPILANGHSVVATVSVGSACGPEDGKNVARLLKSADIAMYYAKTEGRNRACKFVSQMDEKLQLRREIEQRLNWALTNDGFEINYQPLYSTLTNELLGFEALLRLKREDGTSVSPADFIPIAEEMGLIEDIGTWVLYSACRFAADWPRHLKLAVNLSVGQFKSGNLPEIVEHAVWEAKLLSTQLELEITESFLLDDTTNTFTQLEELKKLGVSIAMDDFGTGYSSLAYLWQFPFDKVKVDQSFLTGFEEQAPQVTKIIETIVGLGHTLGMKVTVEGVETQEQFEMLQNSRCDQLQGYLLGRPLAEAAALSCINDHENKNYPISATAV